MALVQIQQKLLLCQLFVWFVAAQCRGVCESSLEPELSASLLQVDSRSVPANLALHRVTKVVDFAPTVKLNGTEACGSCIACLWRGTCRALTPSASQSACQPPGGIWCGAFQAHRHSTPQLKDNSVPEDPSSAAGDDAHSNETMSKLASTAVAHSDPWKHGLHGVVGKDGVLMINLLRQPDRFNHSSSLLSQIGIYPVLFPGTDGQDAQTSQASLDDACFAEGCRFREVQALADSHRRALLVAQQRASDWTAILEDDVVPVTGLHEHSSTEGDDWLAAFDAAWASLPPHAKLVRLGRCIVKNWETQAWPSQVGMELYSYAPYDSGNFRVTQWTGFNGEYAAGGCTHAYVVHKSILPELLSVFPCRCPLDCCFEGFLYNNRQDKNTPNDFLYNIDTQTSPDDAWRESTHNGGFLQNVMQFGVLRQDWKALPHGVTETAKAHAPFEFGVMAKVAPKGEGRWR
jgi:hypothetical protein